MVHDHHPARIGKTTVAPSVGSIFVQLGQDSPWRPSTPTAPSASCQVRIDHAVGSYGNLPADDHLDTFSDVRTKVGTNADGLFSLCSGRSPMRSARRPTATREGTSPNTSESAVRRCTGTSPTQRRRRMAGRLSMPQAYVTTSI
jgi:hypothetical protein